jgi:hypothetical protein
MALIDVRKEAAKGSQREAVKCSGVLKRVLIQNLLQNPPDSEYACYLYGH